MADVAKHAERETRDACHSKKWAVTDITAIVGLFTSIVGTLVGAFLGVQVGAAGKGRAQDLAQRALAALPPEKAEAVARGR